MLIRKITLNNFRNFKKSEIEFSCDPEKNFTIILGNNTHGKTTLVKSFLWCLYRVNLFNDKILLNSDVADYMKPNQTEVAKVEIELDHKEYSYKITTKEVYVRTPGGAIIIESKASTSILKISGENAIPVRSSLIEEEIESILRPELKEYFFFDGETNSIETISSRKNLTDAVTNILGLNNVEKIKDYYDPQKSESVTSYFRKELIPIDENAIDNLSDQLEKATAKKEKLNQEISEIDKEVSKLDNEMFKLNAILDGNKEIGELQNEKKIVEQNIKNYSENREKTFGRLLQSMNSSNALLKVLFATSFVKFYFEKLRETSSFTSDKSYVGITENGVDQLIKNGECICGTKLLRGSEALAKITVAKTHMEPHDYGKYIGDFIDSEKTNIYHSETILDSLIAEAGSTIDSIEKIDDSQERLKKIKHDIEGKPDIGEIQRQLNNAVQQKSNLLSVRNRIFNVEIPEINGKITDINDKIEKSSDKSQANDFTMKCIEYCESIHSLAVTKISNSKILIRQKLQEEVGSIFSSMYHGNREIKIDENFKASTIVSNVGKDKKIDGSTGLGTVVNYSFVAGLMNLAKKSIINNDEIGDADSTIETYPLVMDAPFSNTDEEHIKNICKSLSGFCDQIIMFVMKKDFNYASESISNRIGKMYMLNKISETEAKEEEVTDYGNV